MLIEKSKATHVQRLRTELGFHVPLPAEKLPLSKTQHYRW